MTIKTNHTHTAILSLCSVLWLCLIQAQLLFPKAYWSYVNNIHVLFTSLPPPFPFLCPFCPLSLVLQALTNVKTTMVAAPTSAGIGELVMSVTVLQGTNSWTKRLVEVKKRSHDKNTDALIQQTLCFLPCSTLFDTVWVTASAPLETD